jgi:hypothetical protein
MRVANSGPGQRLGQDAWRFTGKTLEVSLQHTRQNMIALNDSITDDGQLLLFRSGKLPVENERDTEQDDGQKSQFKRK